MFCGSLRKDADVDGQANRQIGEYVLQEQVGRGGAGVVYRAYQPTVNRAVAIKLIELPSTASGTSAAFTRRFTQEAQVLASLEHPHIVPVYHYGIVDSECAYIAMRLMHQSLSAQLARGPLPPEHVMDIALQLVDGLSYAHRRGVLHRDIKPQNILFDDAGSACLADFGLAYLTDPTLKLKQLESMRTGALYIAPEQIRGASMDHRADIYSLGVILYQMLTGRAPFEPDERGTLALLSRIEREEPLPLRKLNPDIPPALERVVMQALRKEPRERYFDVVEMANALERSETRLRERRQSTASQPIAPVKPRFWQRPRVQIGVAALVCTALLILIAAISSGLPLEPPPATAIIETGVRGALDAAQPTQDEIARAQRRLGKQEFIAYVACNLDSQFETTRAREMSDQAASYGLPYHVYDSAGDAYKQLTLIEQARMEGAQALIICPLKPNALEGSLTSLHEAGLPFVLTDAPPDAQGGVMLEADDAAIGALAGHYVAATLPGANEPPTIVILDQPDYAFSDERVAGFLDALHERRPDAQILGQFAAGADQAASRAAVAALLANGAHIDAIFSVTDVGAYGAAAALAGAHVEPTAAIIVSVNAESLALSDIYNQDYLQASVDIARQEGSRGAVNAVVRLLGGGTLPEILTLPPAILITRDIIMEQASNQ